jgi:UDP-glucose 4-epimerase
MDLSGKRLLVIGGAGLIGSHTVDALLAENVAEIRVFDNFARGRVENLADALRDKRAAAQTARRRHSEGETPCS